MENPYQPSLYPMADLAARAAALDISQRVVREFEFVERINRMINPALEYGRSLRFAENLSQSVSSFEKYVQSKVDMFQTVTSQIIEQARQIQSSIDFHIRASSDLIREIAQSLQWVPTIPFEDLFKEIECFLISEGWYLSLDLPFSVVCTLDEHLGKKQFARIEHALCNFFRGRIGAIEEIVAATFPRHERHLTDAMNAHRDKKYSLSIPALLRLADAMSRELWNENFFRTQRSNARIRELATKYDLSTSVIRHLLQEGSLRSSHNPGRGKKTLNRHSTIHGNDLDFDTEANSLRCIALLEFFASLKTVFEVKPTP